MANVNHEMRDNIMQFIKTHVKENGYPPSVREIANEVGLKSPASVQSYLKSLVEEGRLKKEGTKSRSIKIPKKSSIESFIEVPLIGSVAAGMPIFAEENVEEMVSIPAVFGGHGELFMLRVKGESMNGAGILNGDYVVVRKQNTADDGDIVVAMMDSEATVKRYFKHQNMIKLMPENPRFVPIYADNATVAGRVTGVIRTKI